MEEVIERMKTLVLAETSDGESSYSQEILDAMREDDGHYFEVMREDR